MADEDANVQVFCRVRPPNEREGAFAKSSCVTVAGDARSVLLTSRHAPAPRAFTFDRAFGERAAQRDVFAVAGAPITRACLQGYNGTIFAYGQTGSGKTFTMQGPERVIAPADASRLSAQDAELRGLVPRVFDFLFDGHHESDSSSVQHTFACSFLEIYNERVFDLLDGGATARDAAAGGLQLRENGRKGVFVEGLTESVVADAAQAAQLMAAGAQNRRVGQTAMNRESSRSHSVFVLQIQSRETTPDGVTRVRSSRFNLVDLAGSERQRSTEAAGERLKEAGSINKSLSALGNVIMGLVEQSAGKNRHVHYRDSKLTFLLKDSLGGNSKTFMIATVSPADDSAFETLSTLKFAQRAKLIRNNAVINEDSTGSVLVLQEEIMRLRLQLRHAQLETAHAPCTPLLALPASDAPAASSFAQCDPAVDGRFRDLEAAFATSVEKNGQLKRSNERRKVQEEHLKALCAEMKRSITHLRMVLRLRQSSSSSSAEELENAMVDYEPSVDAIEWRLKYEELEESYAELQDEIQQRRMAEQFAGFERSGHVEGEVESLNLMLLALTKQLACVVRDKHELRDRLLRITEPPSEGGGAADVEMAPATLALVESDKLVAQLRDALVTQAHELTAKANAALVARDAAMEKAQDAALELLDMKQKEAAWSIQVTERDIRLQDSARLLRQAEEARVLAGALLQQERQTHQEELVRASQAHAGTQLDLEAKLSDALTSKLTLAQDHSALKDEAASLRLARDELAQTSSAQAERIAALTLALAEKDDELERRRQQHALEVEQLRAQVQRSNDALSVMEIAHSETLRQKADEVAQLHARFETTALESAQSAEQLQRAHEDRVRSLETASAECREAFDRTRSALETELSVLKTHAAQLEDERGALSSSLQEAGAATQLLDRQLREERGRSGEQRAELESCKASVDALQAANDALIMERESLRADVTARVDAIRKLEQRGAALQTAVETRDTSAQRQAVEMAALAEQLSAAKLREAVLVGDLTSAREQMAAAAAAHSASVARLQETHAAEVTALQTHLETVSREFAAREQQTAHAHDAQLRELEELKSALQRERDSTCASLEAELTAAQTQSVELERDVSRLSDKLASAASAATRLEQELSEQQQTRRRLQAELEMLQAAHDGVRADAGEQVAAIEALAQSKTELVKRCEELQAAAAATAESLSREAAALTDELTAAKTRGETLAAELAGARKTHVAEVAALKQSATTAAAELRATLTASLEEAHAAEVAALATSSQTLQAELEMAVKARHDTERELAVATSSNAELSTAVAELRSTLTALEQTNRELQQDHESAERLERLEEDLEAKRKRVDADLKEAVAVRKQLESVTTDLRVSQVRVAELEPLVAQLRRDKQALERETAAQSARLENVSKANDKLVGHDNQRQKIQYHFRVKEENNRLLGEVRQLTDDKFRLQTALDKLRRALREKENVAGVKRPLGASSAANATSATPSATSSSAIKKLLPVSGGLESSSLATSKPSAKRAHSHSRIER